jgi:NADH-quinone oxidoreductase subunit A
MYNELVAHGQAAIALGEMGAFLALLLVGFVYIWKKGGLEWQ